jgi:hypothetical protein
MENNTAITVKVHKTNGRIAKFLYRDTGRGQKLVARVLTDGTWRFESDAPDREVMSAVLREVIS